MMSEDDALVYHPVMRTTVSIDDDLLDRAKELAVRRRTALSSLVEDGLRVLLARSENAEEPAAAVELPVYGGSGLQPGVDLEDKESLAVLLDGRDESGQTPPHAPR